MRYDRINDDRRGRRTLFLLLAGACLLNGGLSGMKGPSPTPQEAALPLVEYKIGPKDLLEIKVFERPELDQTVRVGEDGSITLAMIGKVDVAGLGSQALEKKLAAILEEKWLKTAHVTVFVKEHQRVAVIGAVGKPGMYEMVGQTDLLQVISQAGGLTDQAMSELYIFREGPDGQKTKITVDVNALVNNGQTSNILLQPKDVVSVPIDRVASVYVYGEVKNPGAITFKISARFTLLQAIAQAGGTTEWASKGNVTIKRVDKTTGKELKIDVNLKKVIQGKTPDIRLVEGDVIIVRESIIG